MKNLTQKLISFTLVIAMSMGVATLPAFAADPDTTYFESNSRYYWTGASGTHDLPSGTKLGNLVAKGINFLSLDLASLQSTLSQIGSTLNTTINTNTKPLIDLKSGWGSTLNLYTVPSGYGSSWYAQIVRGLYDIKDLNDSIKSLLYTSTGNQTTIINKLNSGINIILDPTIEGYIQNSSEQLTTISGINSNIVSNTSNILSALSTYVGNSVRIHRRYGVNNAIQSTINVNGLSVPNMAGTDPTVIGAYSMTYGATSSNALLDFLGNSNIIANFTLSKIWTPLTQYRERQLNSNFEWQARSDNNNNPLAYLSIADMIDDYSRMFIPMIAKLQYALADDDMIAAKRANAPQEQSVISNFTGSGDASASVSDFVGVKDSVSALKNSLSGGASYNQAFNILGGDSDGWSWFTTEVAESMDSTSNGSTRRGSVPVSTPYLDSYYDSIYSVIGINGGIE